MQQIAAQRPIDFSAANAAPGVPPGGMGMPPV